MPRIEPGTVQWEVSAAKQPPSPPSMAALISFFLLNMADTVKSCHNYKFRRKVTNTFLSFFLFWSVDPMISAGSSHGECCPLVADPKTVLVLAVSGTLIFCTWSHPLKLFSSLLSLLNQFHPWQHSQTSMIEVHLCERPDLRRSRLLWRTVGKEKRDK